MSRNYIEDQASRYIPPEVTAERLGGEVVNIAEGKTVVRLPQEPDARLTIDDIGLKIRVRGFSNSRSNGRME